VTCGVASFSDTAFSTNAFSLNAFAFGSTGAVTDVGTVCWRLSIVSSNRSISAQDVNRDIGFLERNKEVDFQDG
jgi:hypothetical protein